MQHRIYPVGGRPQRVVDARQPMGAGPPETLQTLSVFVVAPGEVGAVTFDPPRLAAGVRLVNTCETKDMFLENVTDSDLSYQLHFVEEFVGDTGSIAEARVVSDALPLKKEKSGEFDPTCLLCEHPSGILPARSRTRVPFTFHPLKAGLFEFLVYCKLQVVDAATGAPIMIGNEEAALLRVTNAEAETSLLGDPNLVDAAVQALAGLPLMASITGRATFPKLLIEDVRTEVRVCRLCCDFFSLLTYRTKR